MKYEKIKYPDGQISVKIIDSESKVYIKERINSYEDLFFVRSIVDACNLQDLKLFIPCLFGQRSDRQFSQLQSFDLKLICNIINDCKFKSVAIFDPHSDVSMALINNSIKISSYDYVKKAFEEENEWCKFSLRNGPIIVSPDAGAYKKCFEYGDENHLNTEVVSAVKHRDLHGKVNLKFLGDVKDKNCMIVDDLADGGYTFKVLSEDLKQKGAARVTLYVSHAYFTKGFDELSKTIDHIYCTNSVKDIDHPFVTQYKII